MKTISGHVKLGREQGAQVLTSGDTPEFGAARNDGCHIQPTAIRGDGSTRIVQQELLGSILSVTAFKDEA